MSAKNLTLYIPAETAQKMDLLQEVNWSKIARDAIEQYIEDRLDTTIPSEVLSRLRKEMGEEFANGRKLVVEKLGPNLTYKRLISFFDAVDARVEAIRSEISMEHGISESDININIEAEAIAIIKKHFKEIPSEASTKFCEGFYSMLNQMKKKLEEK
jgi:predicted DNA-binding protein